MRTNKNRNQLKFLVTFISVIFYVGSIEEAIFGGYFTFLNTDSPFTGSN